MKPETVFPNVNRSWCNGTMGIYRGILALGPWAPDVLVDVVKQKLLIARSNTSEVTRFCCGSVADIDLLTDCPSAISRGDLVVGAERALDRTLAGAPDTMARDLPERFYASLFQGKAGVLYTVLRLFNSNLPSLAGSTNWQEPDWLRNLEV